MNLRTRILGISALIGVLFLSVLTYNLFFFISASNSINTLLGKNLAAVQQIDKMNQTLLEIRADTLSTMVFSLESRFEMVSELQNQALTFYGGLKTLMELNPSLSSLTQNIKQQFQAYILFGSSILESRSLVEFSNQGELVQKFPPILP